MNCQSFDIIVSDLARQDTIGASTREQALAHTSSCEACASKLVDERVLTLGLGALVTEMNCLNAPERVEGQLLAAFRRQRSSPKHFVRRSNWRYVGAAAAAILLIVFGIAGMRWRLNSFSSKPPITTITETTDVKTPPQTPAVVSNDSTVSRPSIYRTQDSYRRKSTGSSRRTTNQSLDKNRNELATAGKPSTAPENSHHSEVATQFMPLGYMSPVSLQEGGQILRVEFPRSAMVSLGLPVNMDRYGERVKADVLVGADGLARAIRFVQ